VFDQPRVLIALLFLFCIRVLGQILVAFFRVTFLPPMEEWFSGLLPYPELLTTQIPIIVLYGKICLDFVRGSGFFVTPRRRLGTGLVIFGSLYLGVMILRYCADLCRRLGRIPEARASHEKALALARQEPERRLLARRLEELK